MSKPTGRPSGRPSKKLDPNLAEFATAEQKIILEAVNSESGTRNAAKKLGISRRLVCDTVDAVTKRAAIRGYSPEYDYTHAVPDGYTAKGISTLYREDGSISQQWVKSTADERRREQIYIKWCNALANRYKGLSPMVEAPEISDKDKLAIYCIGDPHFGLYAWAEEAGEDFDVDKAESYTQAAIDYLVSAAPPAKEALMIEIGDLMHADDARNVTPASGHTLDVDTRHHKVMTVAFKAMVNCILRLLEKHETVRVWIMGGNHDPNSYIGIQHSVWAYFHNNPRVIAEPMPGHFRFYRFGNTLIGATHGDTVKAEQLLPLMATDRREDWGNTEFHCWFTGHIHHQVKKEFVGGTVESLRTMAAKDHWHSSHGYRSRRGMQVVIHDRRWGEIGRYSVDAQMFKARLK